MCLESYKDCKEKKRNAKRPKIFLVLFIIIIALFLITPVSSVDVTFGTDGSISSTANNELSGRFSARYNMTGILFHSIENFQYLHTLRWTNAGVPAPVIVESSLASDSTNVNLYKGDTVIGTGTLSYTSSAGIYQIDLTVTSLDITGLSGTHTINFTPLATVNTWVWSGLKVTPLNGVSANPDSVTFVTHVYPINCVYGYYTEYVLSTFWNRYETSGASGVTSILVTKNISGTNYPSRIVVTSPSYLSGYTPISDEGSLTILNVTGMYFSTPIQISALDSFNRWWNSSYISGPGGISYQLEVVPSSIPPSTTAVGTLSSTTDFSLSNINAAIWTYTDEFGDHLLTETAPQNLLNYGKIGATWYGFNTTTNGFTNNKGATFPNPVTITIPTTGNKSINLQISTTVGGYQSLTAPLQIGDANTSYTRTNVVPQEFLRGNLVTSAIVSFKSVLTGVWTNITVDNWGQATISTQPAQYYDVYANAPGYLQGSRLGIKTSGYDVEQTYIVYMYPLNTTLLAGGNTILYVSLIDGSTLLPITTGAVVAQTAYESSFYTKQIVNSAGIATLYVPNNTKLFVFTEDTDEKYQGKSTFFETGVEPMYEIDFVLEVRKAQPTAAPTIPPGVQQPGAAPGVTIAPGQTYAPGVSYTWAPTPTYLTPRPTTTLPGYQVAYGNFTGFWAPFENMGVAMGARPSEVGVLMMFMLIIGFLILGGWAAGPLGAEVGVVAGMVCSVAFGFLPFAISIAVIAILCLYGALRIWGVTR